MSTIITSYQDAIPYLNAGELVVMPTDTIYGVVASARNPDAVENLYMVKDRQPDKPYIVLIGNTGQLMDLDMIAPSRNVLEEFWPGPYSLIFPVDEAKFSYLHRGVRSIAFRMPNHPQLLQLLSAVGPLVAPSANTEGMPPATTVEEARAYFGDKVAAYIDGGRIEGSPSQLVRILPDGTTETIAR